MPSVHHLNGFSLVRMSVYCLVLLLFIALQTHHLFMLRDIQKSVLTYREPNITNIDYRMYIDIPQEHCRCNIISNDFCLTNLHFKYSYILPLILFILEVYILKDILSLNPCFRRYFLENIYWVFSIFLFLYLSIVIYRSSYHYYLTSFILCCFGTLLYFLVLNQERYL